MYSCYYCWTKISDLWYKLILPCSPHQSASVRYRVADTAIDENPSSPIESIENTSRHGDNISRLVRPVAKRATSDDMSAFARELKVGPNSSEDSDNDDSSLQVLHSDSNIISYDSDRSTSSLQVLHSDSNIKSYDSDRTALSSSKPKGRQTFNSTVLRPKERSLTGVQKKGETCSTSVPKSEHKTT